MIAIVNHAHKALQYRIYVSILHLDDSNRYDCTCIDWNFNVKGKYFPKWYDFQTTPFFKVSRRIRLKSSSPYFRLHRHVIYPSSIARHCATIIFKCGVFIAARHSEPYPSRNPKLTSYGKYHHRYIECT